MTEIPPNRGSHYDSPNRSPNMKTTRNVRLLVLALTLSCAGAFCLLNLTGCVGVVGANAITAAAETAAGNAVQRGALTVPQLNQLATDLAVFPNTPLPATDGRQATRANTQSKATLTSGSAVDGINSAISALTATGSPSAAAGIAWADLQDVVAGLKREVVFANSNPSLVPAAKSP